MKTRTILFPIAFAGSTLFSVAPESASAAVEPVATHHNVLLAELDTVIGAAAQSGVLLATNTQLSSVCNLGSGTYPPKKKANLVHQNTTASLANGKATSGNGKLTSGNGGTKIQLKAGTTNVPKTTSVVKPK